MMRDCRDVRRKRMRWGNDTICYVSSGDMTISFFLRRWYHSYLSLGDAVMTFFLKWGVSATMGFPERLRDTSRFRDDITWGTQNVKGERDISTDIWPFLASSCSFLNPKLKRWQVLIVNHHFIHRGRSFFPVPTLRKTQPWRFHDVKFTGNCCCCILKSISPRPKLARPRKLLKCGGNYEDLLYTLGQFYLFRSWPSSYIYSRWAWTVNHYDYVCRMFKKLETKLLAKVLLLCAPF